MKEPPPPPSHSSGETILWLMSLFDYVNLNDEKKVVSKNFCCDVACRLIDWLERARERERRTIDCFDGNLNYIKIYALLHYTYVASYLIIIFLNFLLMA